MLGEKKSEKLKAEDSTRSQSTKTSSGNASVVNIYSVTISMVRFYNKNDYLPVKNTPAL
jgi:hypothetical protein